MNRCLSAKSSATVIALVLCTACATSAPYQETAAALSKDSYEWRPPGKNEWDALSDEERGRSQQQLESCVRELTTRYVETHTAPSREGRAVDIATCMEGKGWHIVRTEVLVTS